MKKPKWKEVIDELIDLFIIWNWNNDYSLNLQTVSYITTQQLLVLSTIFLLIVLLLNNFLRSFTSMSLIKSSSLSSSHLHRDLPLFCLSIGFLFNDLLVDLGSSSFLHNLSKLISYFDLFCLQTPHWYSFVSTAWGPLFIFQLSCN